MNIQGSNQETYLLYRGLVSLTCKCVQQQVPNRWYSLHPLKAPRGRWETQVPPVTRAPPPQAGSSSPPKMEQRFPRHSTSPTLRPLPPR